MNETKTPETVVMNFEIVKVTQYAINQIETVVAYAIEETTAKKIAQFLNTNNVQVHSFYGARKISK